MLGHSRVDAVMHCVLSQSNDHKALHVVTIDGATKISCGVMKIVHMSWETQEQKGDP